MSFGKRLKLLLQERKITNQQLADAIGVSRGLVTNWCNEVRIAKQPQIEKIIDYLNIDASILFEDETKKTVNFVPISGTASCGACDINSLQDFSKKAYYNGEFFKESLYCVIANGDSMAPEIDDGDEVIIDPDVKPVTGDMVHYKIDDESAIKVLVIDEDAHILQFIPYNPNDCFKTRTIRLDDEDTMDRLSMYKVVSVNKLKFNNRAARLKMIGR